MRRVLGLLLAAGLVAGGCASGVTEADTKAMQKEFSQQNYEKAMIAAGKGAELQKEKDAAAKRGEQ